MPDPAKPESPTSTDDFDLETLAHAFAALSKAKVDPELAHQLVSAEATEALSGTLIAEAVSAASSLAVSEAMEMVVAEASTLTPK